MIPQGELVLETKNLYKNYGSVQAVRNLSLTVKAGEIYGFLGLNGAGKTTTIRMILGLITPDAGQVWLFGKELRQAKISILDRIGCLVETAVAYPNLTVRENLELQRGLINAPVRAIGECIDFLQLGSYANRLAGTLSLGNKQRLSLARALLKNPRFLILDEPVNGLDPAGIVEIRGLLRRLSREQGVAILMSSHLLDEVEQLADRIGIIHQGQLIDQFARGELSTRLEPALEMQVDDSNAAEVLIHSQIPAIKIRQLGADSLQLQGPPACLDPIRLSRLIVGAGIGLKRLNPVKADLETLFLGLTGGTS